ncbi:hypothetical protein OH77DRAFT_43824 [Trametes cingulata]|nr:hypothetical protein OH77DRAFT_43824 [Trametes cingulata]
MIALTSALQCSTFNVDRGRNPLCLPSWQDFLPREHIRCAGWYRLRRRRCQCNSQGLPPRKQLRATGLGTWAGCRMYLRGRAGQSLARNHYERGDIKPATASAYFQTALHRALHSKLTTISPTSNIQARQARAAMVSPEIAGSSRAIAVSFYKPVAECGTEDDNVNVLKDADDSWNPNTERGSEMAMLRWWIAAEERGYEVAQDNVAYVLDQDKSILRFTPYSPSNDISTISRGWL